MAQATHSDSAVLTLGLVLAVQSAACPIFQNHLATVSSPLCDAFILLTFLPDFWNISCVACSPTPAPSHHGRRKADFRFILLWLLRHASWLLGRVADTHPWALRLARCRFVSCTAVSTDPLLYHNRTLGYVQTSNCHWRGPQALDEGKGCAVDRCFFFVELHPRSGCLQSCFWLGLLCCSN